jgi:hypothetical protein
MDVVEGDSEVVEEGVRPTAACHGSRGEFYYLPLFTWNLYELPFFTLILFFCPSFLCHSIICPFKLFSFLLMI